jgi:hypothetical protein
MSKKHLIKVAGQIVPLLSEGQQVMTNGLKKDTSRHSTGSTHSKKDITKSVRRPKARAVQNFSNRVNAYEKNVHTGRTFYQSLYQIEIEERAEVLNPEGFLKQKQRKAERLAERELKKQTKGH